MLPFFLILPQPSSTTLFPYTTLFRSCIGAIVVVKVGIDHWDLFFHELQLGQPRAQFLFRVGIIDRKSTRLNSSHRTISYAVFCLKKKINCASSCKACSSKSLRCCFGL